MRRKLAWLAAIACVAWLVPAWALSLGGIRIHSRLNQPLTASIPLYPASGEVIDENVKVRLASNEDYARAGLERLDFLSDLAFTVEPDRVVITSRRAVREPVIDLLVEVQWSGGRLLRQYTMLLDPEGVGPAPPPLEPSRQAVAPTPETAGQAASRSGAGQGNVGGTRPKSTPLAETPPLTAAPPRRPAPVEAPAAAPPETATLPKQPPHTYGPVRPNETPWSVATKIKPDESVTTEQVIIALFQWNPTAFSSLSAFKPGVTLRVPDVEVMRRVDPAIAKQRIDEARAKSMVAEPSTSKAPATAPSEAAPSAAPGPAAPAPKAETPKTETAPQPETAPGAAPSTAPAQAAPTTSAPAAEQPAATPPPAETTAPPQETPPPAASAPQPAPEKKGGMDWLIPAIIAAAVLFLVILVWRLARRPKSPGADFAMDEGATLATAAPPRPSARVAPVEEPMEEPAPVRATIVPEPEVAEPPQRVNIPEPAPAAAAPPPPPPAAAPAAKPAGMPSFADTALTDTRQIDLEGGDALAEADFHLAYGLYDEAILLLTQAITRDPNRTDVRTKLAEAYFSANRGQEFLDTAKALKGQLDAAGWEKIAVLGRQLFPSDPLFGGSGKTQPAPSGETAPPPRPAPSAAPSNTIPFDMPSTPSKPAAPAAPAQSASIPFELGSLDLDTPLEASSTSHAATSAEGLDLESHISVDDSGMGGGDESSTKLDLARAYIDLGDNDMARGLLSEVIQQGTSEQKATAEELMRKLPA